MMRILIVGVVLLVPQEIKVYGTDYFLCQPSEKEKQKHNNDVNFSRNCVTQ